MLEKNVKLHVLKTNTYLWILFSRSHHLGTAHLSRASRSLSATRIVFATRLPQLAQHLQRLALADIMVDTWPYNQHSGAC
jgi:protein O-GlcNAc transferase